MEGLHLKSGWLEECKDEVMELRTAWKESDKEQREGDRDHDSTSLTDSELGEKIERIRRLMRCQLPDTGRKLLLLLEKHLHERNRRIESDKEQRDHDLTGLTDGQLDVKIERIERLRGLIGCQLPDRGRKLRLHLEKHLDERKRRNDLAKSSFEGIGSVKGERSVNSGDNFTNFFLNL